MFGSGRRDVVSMPPELVCFVVGREWVDFINLPLRKHHLFGSTELPRLLLSGLHFQVFTSRYIWTRFSIYFQARYTFC